MSSWKAIKKTNRRQEKLDQRAEQRNPKSKNYVIGYDPGVEKSAEIKRLPVDDQPIKLKKESKSENNKQIDFYGSYLEQMLFGTSSVRYSTPARSWVQDSVDPRKMLAEVRNRPHSHFPEIDEINRASSKHCRCSDCYRLRRSLISDLQNIVCENR